LQQQAAKEKEKQESQELENQINELLNQYQRENPNDKGFNEQLLQYIVSNQVAEMINDKKQKSPET